MVGISFSVHPLFFAFGLYYAITGRIFVFVIYTLSAVAHEIGHSLVAENCGYRLNKIVLMPFGAVAKGDIDGLKLIDEIKIALAGPFLSLAIGLFFVALWWIIPELYAFTDIVAQANFSMALVNFMPVFPLDGGRVLSALLSQKFGEKKSKTICKIVSVIFCSLLVTSFFITISTPNFSLLFFCAFVVFGTFGKERKNEYVKLFSGFYYQNLKRGMDVKRQAIDKSVTIKKVINLLDKKALNELLVFDGEKQIATLSQRQINKIILNADTYSAIGEYL